MSINSVRDEGLDGSATEDLVYLGIINIGLGTGENVICFSLVRFLEIFKLGY